MTRSTAWILMATLAFGCGEEASSDTAAAQPAPVTPVEVTGTQGATAEAPDELATLRARVAELEQQLATCQGGQPSGTETAAVPAEGATIPEGVDVPSTEEPAPAATTAQATTRDAGTRARRRDDDPSLIDTILGPDGRRRRRRDDDPIELPNPANILLGE